jgi:uncharacterized membrane protein
MSYDDPVLRVLTAALALAGAAISGYLVYTRAAGAGYLCPTGGCEVVQSSHYAELHGIPVAAIGLAGFLLMLTAAAVPGEAGKAAGLSLALAGFVFSGYLVYVQLAALDAVCLWCIASDAVLTLLLAVALVRVCGQSHPTPRTPG